MNKLYYFSLIFFLFFIPTLVFAQGKSVEIDIEKLYKLEMLPIEKSPYTVEFVAVTKNNGDLVSVIYGDVYNYLPHPITDIHLNKFPSNIITENGVKYKKWLVWVSKHHDEEKAIHGSELKADVFGKDQVVIFRAIHASIVVEENDTTDYFMTVLKRLD